MDFLTTGETVHQKLRTSRRSPRVLKFYALGVLVLVLAVSIFLGFIPVPTTIIGGVDVVFWLEISLLVISAFCSLYGEMKRKMTGEYIITNLRIIVKSGLFRTKIDSVTNKMIVNVRGMQTILQKILNIGDVDITTSQSSREIELIDINGFKDVENLIYKLLESRNSKSHVPIQKPVDEKQPVPAQQQVNTNPPPEPTDNQNQQRK